jgi:hypothetical protein
MEPVTFNRQTTQPPGYLAGRRFVPLGSSGSDVPTLTTPIRGYLFVWIYFNKSRRYHFSTNYGITKPQNYPTTAFVWHVFKKSAQITRRARWLSATTLAPHCRRSWRFFQGVWCTLALAGSARGAGVSETRVSDAIPKTSPSALLSSSPFFLSVSIRVRLCSPRPISPTSDHSPFSMILRPFPLSFVLITVFSRTIPLLAPYSNRVSNTFFSEGKIFKPRLECLFYERKPFEPRFPSRTARGRLFSPAEPSVANHQSPFLNCKLSIKNRKSPILHSLFSTLSLK